MLKELLVYNSGPSLDVRGEFVPYRDVGRPRARWDDYLKAFVLHYFPNRNNEHWSNILRSVERVGLEQHFVEFSMSR